MFQDVIDKINDDFKTDAIVKIIDDLKKYIYIAEYSYCFYIYERETN